MASQARRQSQPSRYSTRAHESVRGSGGARRPASTQDARGLLCAEGHRLSPAMRPRPKPAACQQTPQARAAPLLSADSNAQVPGCKSGLAGVTQPDGASPTLWLHVAFGSGGLGGRRSGQGDPESWSPLSGSRSEGLSLTLKVRRTDPVLRNPIPESLSHSFLHEARYTLMFSFPL